MGAAARVAFRAPFNMTVRSLFWVGWLAVLAGVVACHSAADSTDQKPVRQVFTTFEDALGSGHARLALDQLDQPTRDYLQAAVTTPADPAAPDEEVRELIRQTVAKLTPGGIQPGFQLETPLQRVLDAGWINAHVLQEIDLGPVTIQGDQARAEVIWQGEPSTLQLAFVRESGVWKIDLLQLVNYGELALRMDRTVKGETEAQQIARLVAQVPVP